MITTHRSRLVQRVIALFALRRRPTAMRRPPLPLVSLLVALCLTVPAAADNIDWIGGDGSFNDPDNWLQGTVPGSGDIADIGDDLLAQNATVDLDAAATVNNLFVDNGMWLRFNDNALTVSGVASVSGQTEIGPDDFRSSRLIIDGDGGDTNFDVGFLQVSEQAQIELIDNARVTVRERLVLSQEDGIAKKNIVSGHGRIDFTDSGNAAVLINDNLIYQAPSTNGVPLHFRATNGGRFDLDGLDNNDGIDGQIDVGDAGGPGNSAKIIFEADGLTDAADVRINIARGNEVVMDLVDGWTLDSAGFVQLTGGTAQSARISGTQVNVRGAIIVGSFGETVSEWLIDDTTISPGAQVLIGNGDLLEFKTDTQTVINGGTFELSENANLDFEGPTHINGGTFTQGEGDGPRL